MSDRIHFIHLHISVNFSLFNFIDELYAQTNAFVSSSFRFSFFLSFPLAFPSSSLLPPPSSRTSRLLVSFSSRQINHLCLGLGGRPCRFRLRPESNSLSQVRPLLCSSRTVIRAKKRNKKEEQEDRRKVKKRRQEEEEKEIAVGRKCKLNCAIEFYGEKSTVFIKP